jgi:hypothetical protein
MSADLRPFERVYVTTNFNDLPRAAFADFAGRPHAFDAVFDVGHV